MLLEEVIRFLDPRANQNFIDCTLGGGGHTEEILKKTSPKGQVLGIEADIEAAKEAKEHLKPFGQRAIVVHENYKNLTKIKTKNDLSSIAGIIVDLGLSSDQLDRRNRGFSYKDSGPLDMRYDMSQDLTASDIILTWPEDQLLKIFREYGEVRQAHRLVTGIVGWRRSKQKQKFIQTSMFSSAILRIMNIKKISELHTIWQALRIAVNQELDNLESVLPQALDILSKNGRLAVISFHSLEDRLVKNFFKSQARGCVCPPESPICTCQNKPKVKILTSHGIKADLEEIKANSRSRSAILRVVQKI